MSGRIPLRLSEILLPFETANLTTKTVPGAPRLEPILLKEEIV